MIDVEQPRIQQLGWSLAFALCPVGGVLSSGSLTWPIVEMQGGIA